MSNAKSAKRKETPFKDFHEFEYGLQVTSRDESTSEVTSVACRFCIVFGRDEGMANRKRRRTENVKYFRRPFRVDHYKTHFNTAHPTKWKEFYRLGAEDKKLFFNVDPSGKPVVNPLHAHLETDPPFTFRLDAQTVHKLLEDFFPAANEIEEEEDIDDSHKGPDSLPSWFRRSEDEHFYDVEIKTVKQFQTVRKVVAAGSSFRATSQIVYDIARVFGLDHVKAISEAKVRNYVRATVLFGLQTIAQVMRSSWAYSLAFDTGTNSTHSYLDVRVRLLYRGELKDLHLLALPLLEIHAEQLFAVVDAFLSMLDSHWRMKVIGVSSHGAQSIAEAQHGVATLIEQAALPGVFRISCALQQLDIVVRRCISAVQDDIFCSQLTALVGYLRRQQTFTVAVNVACPKIATAKWPSPAMVSSWLIRNIFQVTDYLEQQQPACKPTAAWWVELCAVDRIMQDVSPVLTSLRGLTTLIPQQRARLEELEQSLRATLGVHRMGFQASNLQADRVVVGDYEWDTESFELFIRDQGSIIGSLFESLSSPEKLTCFRTVASAGLGLINGVRGISAETSAVLDQNTNKLPAVTPKELVNLRPSEFISTVLDPQRQRLMSSFGKEEVYDIEVEQRELCRAVQAEEQMRSEIQKQTDDLSFQECWSFCLGRFPMLTVFCGGLATVYPGTATAESDFSVVKNEGSDFRHSLADLSVEGILHCQQFDFVAKLC